MILSLQAQEFGVSEVYFSDITLLCVAPVIKLLPIQLLLTLSMTHNLGAILAPPSST